MATQAANAAPPAGEETEAEAPDVEVPADDETETETEETEGESPGEEGTEETEGETETDGEKPPADETPTDLKALSVEELTAQLTEDQLRKVGQKFANKTMAAARRAERATDETRAANERITAELTTYKEFVGQIKSAPMTALRRVFGPELTFKQFAEMVAKGADGADPAPADPRIAELQRRLDEKERREREANIAENVRASQARTWDVLGKEPERFDLVLTDIGKGQLWDAIVAYYGKWGSCPDDKVFAMADVIEKRLEDQVSKSKKFALAQSAKKGTPPAAKPNAGAKGKTITNRSSAGAPSQRENKPETEAERDRRINREMREAGELRD